jgi:hypothetical protein
MTDDATLVAAYKQGDASAFEALYTKHLRPLYGVVYVRTHHQQTAEDIVSQTFLRALERINTFDPAKGSFGGWLFTIARNLIVDHYRKAKPTSDIQECGIWQTIPMSPVTRMPRCRRGMSARCSPVLPPSSATWCCYASGTGTPSQRSHLHWVPQRQRAKCATSGAWNH